MENAEKKKKKRKDIKGAKNKTGISCEIFLGKRFSDRKSKIENDQRCKFVALH